MLVRNNSRVKFFAGFDFFKKITTLEGRYMLPPAHNSIQTPFFFTASYHVTLTKYVSDTTYPSPVRADLLCTWVFVAVFYNNISYEDVETVSSKPARATYSHGGEELLQDSSHGSEQQSMWAANSIR